MNTRHRSFPRGGFTLTELLVVIAVMALMFVIVAPSIGGLMQGQGMTRAIDRVTGTLDKARSVAMSQSTYTWVGLMPMTVNGQACVLLCAVSSPDGTNAPATVNGIVPPALLSNITLATGLTKWVSAAQTSSTTPFPSGNAGSFTFTVNYKGSGVKFTSGTFLGFTPQGEAVLQQSVITPWTEIGLQQQMGGSSTGQRVASVRVSGVSGQQIVSY